MDGARIIELLDAGKLKLIITSSLIPEILGLPSITELAMRPFGFGLDAPIDYYYSREDTYEDVTHYISGLDDVVLDVPNGISLTSRIQPVIIDIENFYSMHTYYYKHVIPEFPDLTVFTP